MPSNEAPGAQFSADVNARGVLDICWFSVSRALVTSAQLSKRHEWVVVVPKCFHLTITSLTDYRGMSRREDLVFSNWHLTSHILCPELWQVKYYFLTDSTFALSYASSWGKCHNTFRAAVHVLKLSPCTRSTKLYFLLYSTLAVSVAFKATFSSRLDFYQSCRFCQFVALTVDVDLKKKARCVSHCLSLEVSAHVQLYNCREFISQMSKSVCYDQSGKISWQAGWKIEDHICKAVTFSSLSHALVLSDLCRSVQW